MDPVALNNLFAVLELAKDPSHVEMALNRARGMVAEMSALPYNASRVFLPGLSLPATRIINVSQIPQVAAGTTSAVVQLPLTTPGVIVGVIGGTKPTNSPTEAAFTGWQLMMEQSYTVNVTGNSPGFTPFLCFGDRQQWMPMLLPVSGAGGWSMQFSVDAGAPASITPVFSLAMLDGKKAFDWCCQMAALGIGRPVLGTAMPVVSISDCVSVASLNQATVRPDATPITLQVGGGSAAYVQVSRVADVRGGATQDFEGTVVTLKGGTNGNEAVLAVQILPAQITDGGDMVEVIRYAGAYHEQYVVEIRKVTTYGGTNPTPPFGLSLVATGRAPVAPLDPCGYTRFYVVQTDVPPSAVAMILPADPLRRRALLVDVSVLRALGGPVPIWVGDRGVNNATGYPLVGSPAGAVTAASQGLEIRHTEAVFAVHDDRAVTMRVAAHVERQ